MTPAWSPYWRLRLAAATGLRPGLEPLSEGQVLAILRWWMEIRDGGAGDTGLGMPQHHRTEEPGWMMLSGTIAAKLGRLPGNPMRPEVPWKCSAVEASLYVEQALDLEQAELGRNVRSAPEVTAIDVAGRGGVFHRLTVKGEERARRQRDLDRARATLRKLRDSGAYRVGVESLRWELAAALQDDGAFREAVRRRVTP